MRSNPAPVNSHQLIQCYRELAIRLDTVVARDDHLRIGTVGFLILDDPFARPSRLVENGKQLAIYIRDWRNPIWSNAQSVAATIKGLYPPLRSILVRRMSKRMYEVGNNPCLNAIAPRHSFDWLRVERMILKQLSTDDEIAVQSRAGDGINTRSQNGTHAGLCMIRSWLMKKDVDILLSRMGRRSDAGGKESQEGQNRRNLHGEVRKKTCEEDARNAVDNLNEASKFVALKGDDFKNIGGNLLHIYTHFYSVGWYHIK
jgi:hypothetical protein